MAIEQALENVHKVANVYAENAMLKMKLAEVMGERDALRDKMAKLPTDDEGSVLEETLEQEVERRR